MLASPLYLHLTYYIGKNQTGHCIEFSSSLTPHFGHTGSPGAVHEERALHTRFAVWFSLTERSSLICKSQWGIRLIIQSKIITHPTRPIGLHAWLFSTALSAV